VTALAVPTSLPSASQRGPLLTTVEHFYLVADDAERLYKFFRDELRLPVVWPFNTFGDFASGGLSLGNTVVEFVTDKGARATAVATEFKGIAFEPAGDADADAAELKRRGVRHGDLQPFTFTQGGQKHVGWVTIALEGIPPTAAHIFICDYKDRERVAEGRRRARTELATQGGGPLGVISLKEIVVGVRSVSEASVAWGKLMSPPGPTTEPVFAFGTGPKVRLVKADVEGIQGIVVGIRSEAQARKFLTERNFLADDGGRLRIDPAAIGGLHISLVEE
jgi:hypothetical protein